MDELEKDIERINGVNLVKYSKDRYVRIQSNVKSDELLQLLRTLEKHKNPFYFHDPLYPSISDPGGYFSYSQEGSNSKAYWSMTLGNHGWSGGIYKNFRINHSKTA